MQDPTDTSQHPRVGAMGSPQRGGMGGGFAQGLHPPTLVRHQPPPSSLPAISLSQGAQIGAPVMSTSVLEKGPASSHPRPIKAAPPPSNSGLNMGMVSTTIVGAGGGILGEQPPKRKRGRPRKFATGGELSSGILGAVYPVLPALMPASSSPYTPPGKRGRGRPPGSGKKQQLAALGVVLAGTGQGFTPHILTVSTGEDVSTKIMQFAQHGPRAMCVLSANGAISNVTLRQQSSSGGTVTYEGRYEILSLSGSYLSTDLGGGARQRTGGLSVSLAGSDGRVIGGGVAGMLTAASPIQVVVASFISETIKTKGESSLGSTQGGSSGHGSAPGSTPASALGGHRPLPPRSEPKPSSALGPKQGSTMPPPTGQVSVQRPQPMSVFQPMASSQSAVPGDDRRTDINISLPGG